MQVYWKNQHEKYPEGGKMSQQLDTLNVGDTIEVSLISGKRANKRSWVEQLHC